eukprot:267856-Pyramimonas_sp.AAC.1
MGAPTSRSRVEGSREFAVSASRSSFGGYPSKCFTAKPPISENCVVPTQLANKTSAPARYYFPGSVARQLPQGQS